MGPLLILTVQILCMVSKTTAQFECVGTCYSGRILPDAKNTFHGKHLKGFSYKNITNHDPRKCYSSCTQDCRCKACQIKGERCELLDKDKTSKADSFTAEPGYVYYDLVQTMHQGKSHMVPPGVCFNGCCQSQPCKNGGTCTEHCETPKKKFTCTCKQLFKGSVCEQKIYRSCLDVLRASSGTMPADGFYTIIRKDTDQKMLFYCAFNTPKQAWTLIESFSRSNTNFKNVIFGQSHNGVPTNPISWQGYRLSYSDLMYARKNATMFRSTCQFPERLSSYEDRDYVFGFLQQLDITSSTSIAAHCATFAKVNIRGTTYVNKRLPVWQGAGGAHLHLDSSAASYTCDGVSFPTPVSSEDNFGFYSNYNTDFLCTKTATSTTQWWLGQQG